MFRRNHVLRTRSLMDRISGFGPEDGGSIPPGFVFIWLESNLFASLKNRSPRFTRCCDSEVRFLTSLFR